MHLGISFTLLAGCGGGNPTASPAWLLPSARPHASKTKAGLIYSSSFGENTVDYYRKSTGPNNPIAGNLSGSFANPEGIGVDREGDVYVANSDDENILVYAAGSSSPTSTLVDNNEFPDDVTVAPDGTVYVSNAFGPIGASGDVVVYASGASNPKATLVDADFYHVMGVGLDKRGDLYVACNASQGIGSGTVVWFKPGSSQGRPTHIKLGAAGGVGFDGAGHLLVIDQEVPSLNVYDIGNAKPIHEFTLPGTSLYFAFNRDSSALYLADYANGAIDVYRYAPAKLTRINKITNGMSSSSDNIGIADTPVQQL